MERARVVCLVGALAAGLAAAARPASAEPLFQVWLQKIRADGASPADAARVARLRADLLDRLNGELEVNIGSYAGVSGAPLGRDVAVADMPEMDQRKPGEFAAHHRGNNVLLEILGRVASSGLALMLEHAIDPCFAITERCTLPQRTFNPAAPEPAPGGGRRNGGPAAFVQTGIRTPPAAPRPDAGAARDEQSYPIAVRAYAALGLGLRRLEDNLSPLPMEPEKRRRALDASARLLCYGASELEKAGPVSPQDAELLRIIDERFDRALGELDERRALLDLARKELNEPLLHDRCGSASGVLGHHGPRS